MIKMKKNACPIKGFKQQRSARKKRLSNLFWAFPERLEKIASSNKVRPSTSRDASSILMIKNKWLFTFKAIGAFGVVAGLSWKVGEILGKIFK